MMIAKCKGCGFTAHPSEFDCALSAYHDLRCPKAECGTTAIDTSELAAGMVEYGYGNNNTLVTRPKPETKEPAR